MSAKFLIPFPLRSRMRTTALELGCLPWPSLVLRTWRGNAYLVILVGMEWGKQMSSLKQTWAIGKDPWREKERGTKGKRGHKYDRTDGELDLLRSSEQRLQEPKSLDRILQPSEHRGQGIKLKKKPILGSLAQFQGWGPKQVISGDPHMTLRLSNLLLLKHWVKNVTYI